MTWFFMHLLLSKCFLCISYFQSVVPEFCFCHWDVSIAVVSWFCAFFCLLCVDLSVCGL